MDKTAEFDPRDIRDNKGIAAFAYVGFLFVMPLLGAPDSRFARFHANQGLVLLIDEMIMGVFILASHILSVQFDSMLLRTLRLILLLILYAGMIFCVGFGLVNTLRGKAKELPLIGKTRILR
ncbi:MAG: hypothetical protein J6X30_04380 [Clostridia bacterium]|nr:hypothetical protein [Clostridia bacterium]